MYNELEEVLRYISQQIDGHELISLHTQLASSYSKAHSEPSEEVTQAIKDSTAKIHKAQEAIEPKEWDVVKTKIFQKFGATTVLGIHGHERLIEEISQLSNDPQGAAKIAERFASEITSIKTRAEQVINNLEPLFADTTPLPKGMKQIQIVFDDQVSIEGFETMEQQAGEWKTIMKVFKNAVLTPQEEAKVWKIYKASPTVIIVIAPENMILAIGAVTYLALQIVEKLYSIRQLKLEIRKGELDVEYADKMFKIVEEQEEKKLNNLIEEKVGEAMKKFLPKHEGNNANIAKQAVKHNIKKIYNFVVRGGNVNLIDQEIKDQDTTITQSQLSDTYSKLRKQIQKGETPLLLAKFTEPETKAAEKFAGEEVGEDKKVEETLHTGDKALDDKTTPEPKLITKKRSRPKKAKEEAK
jgi:hypothetical protein